jgi:glycosyltransferase involved in cell wall biosynthesis
VKILYIDGVGPFGGASRSLCEALKAMPPGSAERYFVVQRGTANQYYQEFAADMIKARGLTRFDNTRASHYQGVRWLILLREVYYVPFTIVALLRARLRWKSVDLIHVNEITEIIPGLLARMLFKAPLVVHVRSLQWENTAAWRTRFINHCLRNHVDTVISIDENCRATLPQDLQVHIVHNSFAVSAESETPPARLPSLEKLRSGSLKVGFVGNLHLSKGLFELLEAARIVRNNGCDVEYIIVGGNTSPSKGLRWWFLNKLGIAQDQAATFVNKIAEYELDETLHMVGHTPHIEHFLREMDVMTFPSHYDAPGRPVFEAAFFEVPSIVAVSRPRDDTLQDRVTGLAIERPDPLLLAAAIERLAKDRDLVKTLGKNAKALAERNFSPDTNSRILSVIYNSIAAKFGHIVSDR